MIFFYASVVVVVVDTVLHQKGLPVHVVCSLGRAASGVDRTALLFVLLWPTSVSNPSIAATAGFVIEWAKARPLSRRPTIMNGLSNCPSDSSDEISTRTLCRQRFHKFVLYHSLQTVRFRILPSVLRQNLFMAIGQMEGQISRSDRELLTVT